MNPGMSDMSTERLEELLSNLRKIKAANPVAPGVSELIADAEAEIDTRKSNL